MNEAEREAIRRIHHGVANSLSAIRATLEAINDGVIDPSRERIAPLLESLKNAGENLERLRDL